MASMVASIIGIAVAVYVLVYTVPNAVSLLATSNSSFWGTGAVGTIGSVVLPIVVVVALILMFLRRTGD